MGALDEQTEPLTITAYGPAADGRLPLAEMARLCGEFQATIERIALSLHGGAAAPGRRPKEVVDAVRLTFTGFSPGSAVLELDRIEGPESRTLLNDSLDVLHVGAEAIRRGEAPPEGFSTPVIDGLIRFAGGLGDGFITEVVVQRAGVPIVRVDPPFRQALRETRRRVRHDETTIVGLLQMGDFAPSALRCRIDTIESSVLCTFDGTLSSAVLACLNTMVVASGMGEFLAGGVLRSLDLSEVTTVNRAQRRSLDDLAGEQGISAWGSDHVDTFGLTEPVEEDEFAAFLSGALSSRGNG